MSQDLVTISHVYRKNIMLNLNLTEDMPTARLPLIDFFPDQAINLDDF